MNERLERALVAGGGVILRAESGVPDHVLDYALRAGHLVRLHRGAYAPAAVADDPTVRQRSALAYLGGRAVLSHTTALAIWGLLEPPVAEPVHVTVPPDVRRHGGPGLLVHRRTGITGVIRRGLPVTRLELSIVDSWPLLPAERRRAPVIEAVAGRRTTVDRLTAALATAPRLPDRRALRQVLGLLAAGCHSPLEMWGLEHVFTGPGMPPLQRQVPVRIGGRRGYLDVYAEAERVNFELDGSATHSSPADRERDLRRDAALAAAGITVVRFTYQRMVREPAAVRREVLAILAARRARAAA